MKSKDIYALQEGDCLETDGPLLGLSPESLVWQLKKKEGQKLEFHLFYFDVYVGTMVCDVTGEYPVWEKK